MDRTYETVALLFRAHYRELFDANKAKARAMPVQVSGCFSWHMCTEKRIFNNESIYPDIPLSPNISRWSRSRGVARAAVFHEKIFPICLGSQSGAPPLKPRKTERGRERERTMEAQVE